MKDIDWRKVCLELLDWFNANEGTTYLYDETNRRTFSSKFPIQQQPLIITMLDEYHDKT